MSDLALTCSGLTDLVTDYLDSALDPQRALSFETHAVFCPGCRVFVTQMRETVERLHSLPPERVSPADRDELETAFPERRVIAYKFLRAGRIGPFSGTEWPEGVEVEASGPLDACRNGVHACRSDDLPYWLDDELWEVELLGEVVEQGLKFVARVGRLVRRIDAWDDRTRGAFAEWCLMRVAVHATAEVRDAGLETEAAALEAASSSDEVAAAAAATVTAARRAGAGNAERLAAYAVDAVAWMTTLPPSGVAYIAAHTADSRSRADTADAFAAERALQAQWLAERLDLSAVAAPKRTRLAM